MVIPSNEVSVIKPDDDILKSVESQKQSEDEIIAGIFQEDRQKNAF